MIPGKIRSPIAKATAFRLLAILLGLALIVSMEGILRVAGVGEQSEREDPFIGFRGSRPLFVLDKSRDVFQVDASRLAYFRPESFAASKPLDEFRIFCLGGSTVQGRPYAIETSFTTWLELSLQASEPSRQWNVVNCGAVSYASYRLVPIMRELLQYEPDLFIVYSGHNEFLEDRTYEKIKQTPRLVAGLHGWCSRLRTYNVCRSAWMRGSSNARRSASHSRPVLSAEVDALLDYRGGLADYHRDDDWRQGTVEHYRFNVHRMVQMARDAGVPLVLVNPASNLKDCPPFKSMNRDDLSPGRLAQFASLWQQTEECEDARSGIALLREAIAIDSRHAGAHYLLGSYLELEGNYEGAKAAYLRAKEEDICPLRMIEPLHEALVGVAEATHTPLVDVRGLLAQQSRHGMPGARWFLDHVHPSINGHQLIADALLREMNRLRLVSPRRGWQTRQEQRYFTHLESLEAAYFVRGEERLQNLIYWTKGQADGIRSAGNKTRSSRAMPLPRVEEDGGQVPAPVGS